MARVGVVDANLGATDSTDAIVINGQCDVLIQGLTGGSVKLQYRLGPTDVLTAPAWQDFPGGSFSEDVYKTVFISEDQVWLRLTGVSAAGTPYVRLARHLVR